MTMYVLFYDRDDGNREDWSVFYTPMEIFATEKERADRIAFIENQIANDPEIDDDEFEFHTIEVEMMTSESALVPADI